MVSLPLPETELLNMGSELPWGQILGQPPVLEWTAASAEGADAVRYELAVFDPGETPVYHASNLRGTRHELRANLSAGEYRWTVRPHFLRDGEWAAGPWNRRKYLLLAVVYFQWGETLYEFNLPGPIRHAAQPTGESARVTTRQTRPAPEFERPQSSSVGLRSRVGFMGFVYDPATWRQMQPLGPDVEFQLEHSSKAAWVMLIAEDVPMSIRALRAAALGNAQRTSPEARIVFEENRVVNGTEILCMRMELEFDEIPFTYLGYYWAGDEGAAQLIAYSEQHLFSRFEEDFNDLLNGFEVGPPE